MEEQSITVTLADRPYKLLVKRDDEVLFREAAKSINERLNGYSKVYSFKDRQDLLAMVALQYTTQALRNERQMAYRDQELEEKLVALNDLLSIDIQ